uniref:Inositol monophosphatase n=1 Tax=Trifolium repens TaxID=3899 RepID=D3YBG1_TRIRP|nr:inositol monophosphatase [Trifolium repens]
MLLSQSHLLHSQFPNNNNTFRLQSPKSSTLRLRPMASSSPPHQLHDFASVANKAADAAGDVIRQYFRKNFDIIHKQDLSPVTIADQSAEEAMVSIILDNFPSHAVYGEERGWRCKQNSADYVWVLDPIDGTKSFITGKPVFGTLIALLKNGTPLTYFLSTAFDMVAMDFTTLIGIKFHFICSPFRYTTSPHLFNGDAEEAFIRVRDKVKIPLYGCDCYAYALLSSGFVDLVVESGLKPYDFLALIPVIEGSGGVITDWKGHQLRWEASPLSIATSFNVVAAGDKQIHQQTLDSLQW